MLHLYLKTHLDTCSHMNTQLCRVSRILMALVPWAMCWLQKQYWSNSDWRHKYLWHFSISIKIWISFSFFVYQEFIPIYRDQHQYTLVKLQLCLLMHSYVQMLIQLTSDESLQDFSTCLSLLFSHFTGIKHSLSGAASPGSSSLLQRWEVLAKEEF